LINVTGLLAHPQVYQQTKVQAPPLM